MFNKNKNIDLEFKKNELIDDVLTHYFSSFQCLLDTKDFMPQKYRNKVEKYIFKNLKKKFNEINRVYKNYVKSEQGTLDLKFKTFFSIVEDRDLFGAFLLNLDDEMFESVDEVVKTAKRVKKKMQVKEIIS